MTSIISFYFHCRSLNYFGEDEEEKSTASAVALNRQLTSSEVVTINVDRKSSTGSQVGFNEVVNFILQHFSLSVTLFRMYILMKRDMSVVYLDQR